MVPQNKRQNNQLCTYVHIHVRMHIIVQWNLLMWTLEIEDNCIPQSGIVWQQVSLANLLFLSVW